SSSEENMKRTKFFGLLFMACLFKDNTNYSNSFFSTLGQGIDTVFRSIFSAEQQEFIKKRGLIEQCIDIDSMKRIEKRFLDSYYVAKSNLGNEIFSLEE
ncbi:MAG: hypothetical protein MHPSP_002304, partial [Paramarteilia canceri]